MSLTVNDIFLRALALCDLLDSNGSPISAEHVSVYAGRTPYLCDMAQREISGYIQNPKRTVFDFGYAAVPVDGDAGLKYYELPSDWLSLISVFSDGADVTSSESFLISGGRIYAPLLFGGRLSVCYNAAPSAVTSATSEFCYDDAVIAAAVPYFLASFFMHQEDPSLSSGFYQDFLSALIKLKEAKASGRFEAVFDAQGTECESHVG